MGHVEDLELLGMQLAQEYARLDGVEGFVIGGSVARGFADEDSDLEAYVYHDGAVPPVAVIERIVKHVGAHPTRSVNLHWTHPAWGTHSFFGTETLLVELGYRNVDETRQRIEAYLDGSISVRDGIHDVAFGWYPSGLAACLAECHPLYDPRGNLNELKVLAQQFPARLRDSLLEYHVNEAEGILAQKLVHAHKRGDVFHFQAALARVVRSCVVGIFTVNNVHFPGDKWNRRYLESMHYVPPGFVRDQHLLLSLRVLVPRERATALEVIAKWTQWLRSMW